MEELVTCEGTVHSVIFQNAENGYTVLRLLTEEGEVITVVGCIPCVAPGEHLAVSGVPETHPQHGEQLRAVELERSLPEDEEEIFSYLSSGICKGVGPATARRIVERFGAETLDVLEREPERLTTLKGVTARKAQEIAESFRRHMGLRRLMAFLAQYQLPPILAMELRRQYGDAALEKVRENPYLLSGEACGVAFSVTDEMAMGMGIHGEPGVWNGPIKTADELAKESLDTLLGDMPVARHIDAMKDKAALRRLLAGMYPDFFFREIPVGELGKTDVSGWKKPFILKPSVGFFSLGVYTITSDDDWTAAGADIERNLRESRDRFPESVVDQSSFLVEEYITGEEFAVDVYFDGEGEPVILNIFTHRFASLSDVSDRLYYTGKDVIEANKARFEAFFRKVNALMGIRDFPAHVELRVEGDRILPIEFNAMRFAGLCTTDMAYFAFGINTVDCYLNDRKPDFDAILRGREGKIYSMVILDKPKSLPPSSAFDYDRLAAHFAKVLELRKVDVPELPVFGFAFTESDAERTEELDTILQSDLTEFLR